MSASTPKTSSLELERSFGQDRMVSRSFGFVNLIDDKKFFPVYNPALVIRVKVLEKYPEISNILKPLANNLSTAEMQEMNKLVDVDHESVAKVAKDWLRKIRIIVV